MRQVSVVAAVVLIMISVPCDGDSSDTLSDNETSDPDTPATLLKTEIIPPGTSDDSITSNVGYTSYTSMGDSSLYPLNNQDSAEDQQSSYNADSLPSTVNFNEIYSNSMALLAEDSLGSRTEATEPFKEPELVTPQKDDKSFHLSNVHTRFVEFHPKTQTIPTTTIPPPMFVSKLKNEKDENITTTTSTTTTEEPEELIEVIPLKRQNYQRGLLDLLFPAPRVRTFKSVFDTFKRIMSHTFR